MMDARITRSRWLTRQLKRVRKGGSDITFQADLAWGANYVVAGLRAEESLLAWLALEPGDENDSVQLGNKLAEAFALTLPQSPLQRGAPYAYNLSLLERCKEVLKSSYTVVSHAHLAPDFISELGAALQNSGHLLLLDERQTLTPPNGLVFDQDSLGLNPADARNLAPTLEDTELARLLFESGGALETFLLLLHQNHAAPLPLRPTARGYWHLPNYEQPARIKDVLEALIRTQRWSEALELAARSDTSRISEVLNKAGNYFLAQGLYKQVWNALSPLSQEEQEDETVLFWLLTAARQVGQAKEVLARAKDYLTKHDAPELRAYCANLEADAALRLAQTKRAAELKRSPFTLYQRGLALSYSNPIEATSVLKEAVTLAEHEDVYAAVRNAWALAANQTLIGHYAEAASWASWSLELFKSGDLKNTQRWLLSANEWAYARILIDATAGLEGLLSEAESHLDKALPNLAALVRSTLGDYWLSQREPTKALEAYQSAANLKLQGVGENAVNSVRALLDLDEQTEAYRIAQRAHHLAPEHPSAQLALGMALALRDPATAIPYLEQAVQAYAKPIRAPHYARSACYLALAHTQLGQEQAARSVLKKAQPYLAELGPSGYRYLVGPEYVFKPLLNPEGGVQIELMLLGGSEVRLNAAPIHLSPREIETAALLALYPEGLTGEQLALYLYGEDASTKSVKSIVARLRQRLPITSSPYRFEATLEADFITLAQNLAAGKLPNAANLYRGTLLEQSDSPRITEERAFLEASLRTALLNKGDTEALYQICTVTADDLELWEALLERLASGDARYSVVLNRTMQLRRTYLT